MMPYNQEIDEALERMMGIINSVATIFLSLIGVAVVGLAIYIGFKMATASDDSKRKDAKKQLIFAIVGAVAIIMIIILWNTVVDQFLRGVLS